jgi:hypothetical protein
MTKMYVLVKATYSQTTLMHLLLMLYPSHLHTHTPILPGIAHLPRHNGYPLTQHHANPLRRIFWRGLAGWRTDISSTNMHGLASPALANAIAAGSVIALLV